MAIETTNYKLKKGESTDYHKDFVDNLNYSLDTIDNELKNNKDFTQTHIDDENNPHNVTKEQVGLDKIVNEAQSDTPSEGSNEYFTSGGAYIHTSDQGNPHNVTKEQVGLEDVENYSQTDIPTEGSRLYMTSGGMYNHTSDNNNPHNVTKKQVGLENVDNTSDLDKPISTAQREAINNINSRMDKADIILSDHYNLGEFSHRFGRYWRSNQSDLSNFVNHLAAGTYTISADFKPTGVDSSYDIKDMLVRLMVNNGHYSGDGVFDEIQCTRLGYTQRVRVVFEKKDNYENYQVSLWGVGNHSGGNHGTLDIDNIMISKGDVNYPYSTFKKSANISDDEATFLSKMYNANIGFRKGAIAQAGLYFMYYYQYQAVIYVGSLDTTIIVNASDSTEDTNAKIKYNGSTHKFQLNYGDGTYYDGQLNWKLLVS